MASSCSTRLAFKQIFRAREFSLASKPEFSTNATARFVSGRRAVFATSVLPLQKDTNYYIEFIILFMECFIMNFIYLF